MSRTIFASAVLAALFLAGCSTTVPLDEAVKAGTTQQPATEQVAPEAAARDVSRSVYFAFDSYRIEDAYLPVIEANAREMMARPESTVVIEGNTDERGSREYNIALGNKRSEAVRQRLQLLGIPANRMEAVSFGSEKPVAKGENEEAWAQNRRADIVYR